MKRRLSVVFAFSGCDAKRVPDRVKRRKRQLVLYKQKQSPEPVSSVSQEEESRLLRLADVALHKPQAPHGFLPAGTRAHRDHDGLMNNLREAAERSEVDDAA